MHQFGLVMFMTPSFFFFLLLTAIGWWTSYKQAVTPPLEDDGDGMLYSLGFLSAAFFIGYEALIEPYLDVIRIALPISGYLQHSYALLCMVLLTAIVWLSAPVLLLTYIFRDRILKTRFNDENVLR